MKYIVMDQTDTDLFTKEFETAEEAIEAAKTDWSYLTEQDKNTRIEFFVLESINPDEDAEDHFDGTPIFTFKNGEIIDVEYSGGESRTHSGTAVDYMLATIEGNELYSEMEAVEGDENANYEELKQDIINQAKELGYHRDMLKFWYD